MVAVYLDEQGKYRKTMYQKQLKDIVRSGVTIEIFNAEEAFRIDDVISDNAPQINEAKYGQFFGAIQRYLGNSLVLAVAKLYEKPHKKYFIRSIPNALRILEDHANVLEIPERPTLNKWFTSKGYKKKDIQELSNQDITKELVKYFRNLLPIELPKIDDGTAKDLDYALHATKTTRDKKISHNEASNEPIPMPTYNELLDLLALAKEFAGVMGPFLSTHYEDDKGDYILSSDSGRSSMCLTRVLKKLEVIPNS